MSVSGTMIMLPKNGFQPPIRRRRRVKYGLTPPLQHFRRRPRLIDVLLDDEVADIYIWDGIENIPQSPPETSPESTPPQRHLSTPVIEDIEEELEELHIANTVELDTSTASVPTV